MVAPSGILNGKIPCSNIRNIFITYQQMALRRIIKEIVSRISTLKVTIVLSREIRWSLKRFSQG